MSRESEKSLFQICQDATAEVAEESIGNVGFSVDKVLARVKEVTCAEAWSREWLFDYVAGLYIRVCAYEAAFRSAGGRQGVYINEDRANEKTLLAMIERARLDVRGREEKITDLHNKHVRFVKDGFPYQMGLTMDGEIYEEMTPDMVIELIRRLEGLEA